MDPQSAKFFDSLATAFAVIAVFVALATAVIETGKDRGVPVTVSFLAGGGIIMFVFGRVLRYHFAGY
jgi:di/tricarboxylate transporter